MNDIVYVIRLWRNNRLGIETFFCFEENAKRAVDAALAGQMVDGSHWAHAEYVGPRQQGAWGKDGE